MHRKSFCVIVNHYRSLHMHVIVTQKSQTFWYVFYDAVTKTHWILTGWNLGWLVLLTYQKSDGHQHIQLTIVTLGINYQTSYEPSSFVEYIFCFGWESLETKTQKVTPCWTATQETTTLVVWWDVFFHHSGSGDLETWWSGLQSRFGLQEEGPWTQLGRGRPRVGTWFGEGTMDRCWR